MGSIAEPAARVSASSCADTSPSGIDAIVAAHAVDVGVSDDDLGRWFHRATAEAGAGETARDTDDGPHATAAGTAERHRDRPVRSIAPRRHIVDVESAVILRARADNGVRRVALVTAANLAVNLAFFLSHPVFTPYYTVPIAMLSLWSLLFGSLIEPAEAVDGKLAGQAANA